MYDTEIEKKYHSNSSFLFNCGNALFAQAQLLSGVVVVIIVHEIQLLIITSHRNAFIGRLHCYVPVITPQFKLGGCLIKTLECT